MALNMAKKVTLSKTIASKAQYDFGKILRRVARPWSGGCPSRICAYTSCSSLTSVMQNIIPSPIPTLSPGFYDTEAKLPWTKAKSM